MGREPGGDNSGLPALDSVQLQPKHLQHAVSATRSPDSCGAEDACKFGTCLALGVASLFGSTRSATEAIGIVVQTVGLMLVERAFGAPGVSIAARRKAVRTTGMPSGGGGLVAAWRSILQKS